MTSWKAEVIADSGGQWTSNGLRFPTPRDASDYVEDLYLRWTSVREKRIVQCDEAPTHRWNEATGRAEPIDYGDAG
jgi:hypothetical protein